MTSHFQGTQLDGEEESWSLVVVQFGFCAERLREAGINVVAIAEPDWMRSLPVGGSVLLVDAIVQRLAGDIRRLGVSTCFAWNVPPGYRWPSEFLEHRAKAMQFQVGAADEREVWRSATGNALVLHDVQPTGHQDMVRGPFGAFHFMRPWELAELPPRRLLWDAGFGQGELGLLFGPWGSCKSFVALALAVAIADGVPFLGHPTVQGNALLIIGEGGAAQIDRIRAATSCSRVANRQDAIHGNLNIACVMPSLTHPGGFDATVRAIQTVAPRPSLLVIDTWARATAAAGIDENSTAESGQLVAACDRLRGLFPGMAMLPVHHSGNYRNDRPRGASALPSACDFTVRVDPVRGPGRPRIRLLVDKLKDGRMPPPLVVDFEEVVVRNDERGAPVTSLRVGQFHTDSEGAETKPAKVTAVDLLREALAKAGSTGMDFAEGKAATGKASGTVSHAFSELVGLGVAETFTGTSGEKRWRCRPGSSL